MTKTLTYERYEYANILGETYLQKNMIIEPDALETQTWNEQIRTKITISPICRGSKKRREKFHGLFMK